MGRLGVVRRRRRPRLWPTSLPLVPLLHPLSFNRSVRDPQLECFYDAMRALPSLHIIGDRVGGASWRAGGVLLVAGVHLRQAGPLHAPCMTPARPPLTSHPPARPCRTPSSR